VTPRLPNWQSRLGVLLEERRTAPFAWGTNDCCSFAADCVQACTGVDPWKSEREYADAVGAARTLQKLGGVVGIGDTLFGERVGPGFARVGDVGLVSMDGRDSLAVCNGDTWLGVGEHGLVAVPFAAASQAWRF
jgi:hypothetical protein